MKTFKSILVVSRSTRYCPKVLETGIVLARSYGAKLHLLHIIHDPFSLRGWNLPVPSLEEEYEKMAVHARDELDAMFEKVKDEGVSVTRRVENGEPALEIEKAVERNHVDLILMLAHQEGYLEHFLFGRTNDAVIRKLPATLMLVKREDLS